MEKKLPKSVNFLLGSQPIDSLWYGDTPKDKRPHFWWRGNLRNEIEEIVNQVATLTEDNAKLKAKIETMNNVLLGEVGKLADAMNDVDRLTEENKKLREALKDLIFTASKLWDDNKPLKDTEMFTVTHPIIENAKIILHSDQPKTDKP